MTTIPFWKMSGAGNDFILMDNRQGILPAGDLSGFVAKVCRRRLSVGADGLILIEKSRHVDFKWRFFNSDGSVPEMCGNGARCAARFAYLHGITPAQMAFETVAGVIRAQVNNDQVKINMTDPFDCVLEEQLGVDQEQITYGRINTGVPHVVVAVGDIEHTEVVRMGRKIRHHNNFSPDGTNVNFISPMADGLWAIRTYERGVEGETLACGTGVVAAALILSSQQEVTSPVTLQTRSGSILKVYFTKTQDGFQDIFLEGDARVIYKGQLDSEAWEY